MYITPMYFAENRNIDWDRANDFFSFVQLFINVTDVLYPKYETYDAY